jgi:hypothetical protein
LTVSRLCLGGMSFGEPGRVIATKVFGPMGPGPNQRGLSRKAIHELEPATGSPYRWHQDDHRTFVLIGGRVRLELARAGGLYRQQVMFLWVGMVVQADGRRA